MKIIDITKEVIENYDNNKNLERKKEAFYVSDAGKCKRQMYYSLEFKKPMETNDAVSVLRMDAGKRIEDSIVEMYKEQGILVDDQARVEKKLTEHHEIHGYADAILNIDDEEVPVEIKSFWGHKQAADLKAGKPKKEYVYQLSLYMYYLGYTYGNLLYIDRSNMDMYAFGVYLQADGGIFVDDEEVACGNVHKILADMRLVSNLLSEGKEAPEPDFDYKYDIAVFTAKMMREKKTKAALDKEIQVYRPVKREQTPKDENGKYSILGYSFQGKIYPKRPEALAAFKEAVEGGWMPSMPVAGDFQCKYCDYKRHCLQSRGVELGYSHEEYCARLEVLLKLRDNLK